MESSSAVYRAGQQVLSGQVAGPFELRSIMHRKNFESHASRRATQECFPPNQRIDRSIMAVDNPRYLILLFLLAFGGCKGPQSIPQPSVTGSPPIAQNNSAADEDEPWCLPGNAADWEAYQMALEESKVQNNPDAPPPDISEQLKKLHSASPDDRLDAIRVLGNLGPAAAPAVPDLREALKARHPTVQRDYDLVGFQFKGPVLWALARIGPAAEPAVPDILEVALTANSDLNPPDYEYQILAIQALGNIGSGAEEAVGPLLKLAQNFTTGDVRRYHALRSLRQIGTPDALEGLELFLSGQDKTARDVAAEALLSTRPEVLEPWFATFVEEKPEFAIKLTAGLGYSPGRADFLVASLNSAHRLAAVKALAELGPRASSAIPALLALDGQIKREPLVEALRSIDPEGQRTVPLVVSGLEEPGRETDAMDLLAQLNNERARTALRAHFESHPQSKQRLQHFKELKTVGDPGLQ